MTDDQPFKGLNNVSLQGTQYSPVMQPNCVESVITYLPTGPAGVAERWKYTRYWDNPLFWTTPNVQDVQTIVAGKVNSSGAKTATTVVKQFNPGPGQVAPPADQFEMYNATRDPAELTNLYGDSSYAATQSLLARLLDEQRTAKRLTPTQEPWANGTAQQFPYMPT